MSIAHHPSDTALATFASGTLDEAPVLVIATHLSQCAECRKVVRALEHVGGAFLDETTLADMSAGALQRAMADLDRTETAARHVSSVKSPLAPIAHYDFGSWRRIGRGVQWRSVSISSAENYSAFMLKAEPGTRLPRHRHTDTEWTCVLEGKFRHEFGCYGPGDFDEADETVEHSPVVEDGVSCICLVALKGRLRLAGWMGRLLQPFLRISIYTTNGVRNNKL
jgi:putative transcriptional regulator